MKKLLALTLFICCYTHYSIAQVPEPTIITMEGLNGDVLDSVEPNSTATSDGGIIICLETNSTYGSLVNVCPNLDWPVIYRKYNADASKIEWQKCYPRNTDTNYRFIFPTGNGTFVRGGSTKYPRNIIVYKEKTVGDTLWGPKTYGGSGGEIIRDMINTRDGGFLILSSTTSKDGDVGKHFFGTASHNNIWGLKIDSVGNIEWSNVFGGTDSEDPYRIIEIPNYGGYYFTGKTRSKDYDCITNHSKNNVYPPSSDVLIVKIDTAGNKIWSKCYGGSDNDGHFEVVATNNGNDGLLVTTYATSSDGDLSVHADHNGLWVFNIDSSGNILWNKSYGKNSYDYPHEIHMAADGTIWIGGNLESPSPYFNNYHGKFDAFIMHLSQTGDLLSSKLLGTSGRDFLSVLHPLSNGLILVAGKYWGNDGNLPNTWIKGEDIYIAKIAPWTVSIPNTVPSGDNINIYPNPTNSYFTIQHSTPPKQVQVFDINGRCIYTNPTPNSTTKVNTDTWAKGVYLIWVSYPDGKQQKQTIVKQ